MTQGHRPPAQVPAGAPPEGQNSWPIANRSGKIRVNPVNDPSLV